MMKSPRSVLQLALALIIVILSVAIYRSVTVPYRAERQREAFAAESRRRMAALREVLVRHSTMHRRFPTTLDSVVLFARTDSVSATRLDSLFGPELPVDSITRAPRSGRPYLYWVNDTAAVRTYLIKDPDSDDYIGTLGQDHARIHAASWE